MSASTGPRDAFRKPGEIEYHLMGATKINKGTLVVIRNDGYAYPLRAPASGQADVFAGIAYETVDNSAGSAGATGLRLYKTGSHVMNMSSPTQASVVGQALYGADDQTVSTTSTNAVLVGYGTDIESSGTVRLRVNRAVQ